MAEVLQEYHSSIIHMLAHTRARVRMLLWAHMAIQQFRGLNVAMATSGNEYGLTIPPQAVNVQIRLREGSTASAKVYVASVGNGGTPLNYITVDSTRPLVIQGRWGGQSFFVMPGANTLNAEIAYLIDT